MLAKWNWGQICEDEVVCQESEFDSNSSWMLSRIRLHFGGETNLWSEMKLVEIMAARLAR